MVEPVFELRQLNFRDLVLMTTLLIGEKEESSRREGEGKKNMEHILEKFVSWV